jgi:ribosomal protein L5
VLIGNVSFGLLEELDFPDVEGKGKKIKSFMQAYSDNKIY